jgi:hypothetical protein
VYVRRKRKTTPIPKLGFAALATLVKLRVRAERQSELHQLRRLKPALKAVSLLLREEPPLQIQSLNSPNPRVRSHLSLLWSSVRATSAGALL